MKTSYVELAPNEVALIKLLVEYWLDAISFVLLLKSNPAEAAKAFANGGKTLELLTGDAALAAIHPLQALQLRAKFQSALENQIRTDPELSALRDDMEKGLFGPPNS